MITTSVCRNMQASAEYQKEKNDDLKTENKI